MLAADTFGFKQFMIVVDSYAAMIIYDREQHFSQSCNWRHFTCKH